MNPVGWFEIPVTDMDRAQKFYEAALAVSLSRHLLGPLEMAWFPTEASAAGAAGALVKGEHRTPSRQGTLVYFSVGDISTTLQRIGQAGGKTVVPRMSIGEYGFMATFEDSEGNLVALHSRI